MTTKQYAERDAEALDDNGGYYFRHVSAMTGESLHSKSDIAAELGHRDMMNDRMKRLITEREQRIDALAAGLREALEMAHELDSHGVIHLERLEQVERLQELADGGEI